MPDKRIALVTGANQGVGLQVAKELVANGVTVLRNSSFNVTDRFCASGHSQGGSGAVNATRDREVRRREACHRRRALHFLQRRSRMAAARPVAAAVVRMGEEKPG